jgi:hypothetical protein
VQELEKPVDKPVEVKEEGNAFSFDFVPAA